MVGFRTFDCTKYFFSKLICKILPVYPQDYIMKFYDCLNENFASDSTYTNKYDPDHKDMMFKAEFEDVFGGTDLSPINALNMCYVDRNIY